MIVECETPDGASFGIEMDAVPAPGDVIYHDVVTREALVTEAYVVAAAKREWHTVHNEAAALPEQRRPRMRYVVVQVTKVT